MKKIVQAKKILWTLCASDLESYTQCKNTDKRSSSKAHIKDIFDAFVKLDSSNKQPSFVAKNFDQLPNRHPEELNLVSIINRIYKLEEKQTEFDNMMIKHDDEYRIKMFEDATERKNMDEKISCQNDRLITLEAANDHNLNELHRLSKDIRIMINEFESKPELETNDDSNDHGNDHQMIKSQNPTPNDQSNNNYEVNEVFVKFLDSCN